MEEEIRIMKTYGKVTTGSGPLLMNATLVHPKGVFRNVFLRRYSPTTEAAVKNLYSSLRTRIKIECGIHFDAWGE